MKKTLIALLALALLAAVCVTALADADVRTANKTLKVYEKKDTHSTVLGKIGKGDTVLIEEAGSKWCGILTQDPSGDGQTIGWVQTKYLSCDHSWTDWKIEREATCTRDGLRTRKCTKCGEKQEKKIEKTGHTYGKWIVERKGTCARPGLQVRTCKVCGYEEEQQITVPHTYGRWTVTKEPTCTEKGQRVRTCEVCDYEDHETIKMVPHDYEWRVIVEATDHSSGTRAQVCRVCGHEEAAENYDPEGTLRRGSRGNDVRELQQLLIDQGYLKAGTADGSFGGSTEKALMKFQSEQGLNADGVAWPQTQKRLAHDFGPWQTVKEMTRTTPGERVRVCQDCGYEQHETVEMGDVIERGSRGENVRAIQQMLKQVGYDAGSLDGVYGKKLDTAFTAFDAAHGLTFEAGKVRPADLDALVSAWLEADAELLKQSSTDAPVDLALSVTPSADETSDGEVTAYSWKLSNLGSEKCKFTALLLTYGNAPDFTGNDLVMVIDGEALKPNANNSLTGTFSVAKSWGDGNLNFAAIAVSEKDGTRWLSNTVVYEAAGADEPRTVEPLPVALNAAALPDGTYPVSFDRGDIASVTSGIFMNAVHVYTMDTYDARAIEALAVGDTVVVEGNALVVETIGNLDDIITINGGIDADNGTAFIAADDGCYRVLLDDDRATYTDHGVTTLALDSNAVFVDGADITQDPITVNYDGLVDAIKTSKNDSFDQYNTTVKLENGKVVEISRIFTP